MSEICYWSYGKGEACALNSYFVEIKCNYEWIKNCFVYYWNLHYYLNSFIMREIKYSCRRKIHFRMATINYFHITSPQLGLFSCSSTHTVRSPHPFLTPDHPSHKLIRFFLGGGGAAELKATTLSNWFRIGRQSPIKFTSGQLAGDPPAKPRGDANVANMWVEREIRGHADSDCG